METPALLIRAMTEGDLLMVMHNENTAYSHPWSESVVRDCLAGAYQCVVMENARRRIIGHAIIQTVLDEAQLLNLCIAPEQQGQGLGRVLIHECYALAKKAGAERMFLEVRVSNQTAYSLYRSEGFSEIGRRKNYYPAEAGREDGLVMMRAL